VFEPVLWLVRLLVVIGSAVVGGFLTGALVGLVVRLRTGEKMPGFVRWVMRVLGAILFGLLAYYYAPIGWGNGPGPGPGPGPGNGHSRDSPSTDSARDTPKDGKPQQKDREPNKVTPLPSATDALTIEVLGVKDLKRLADAHPSAGIDARNTQRCYRIWDGHPERLLPERLSSLSSADRANLARVWNLEQVQTMVQERLGKDRPVLRRVSVLYYPDSPLPIYPEITKLVGWLRELPKVVVDGRKESVQVEDPAGRKNEPPVE
jgi:hypothetical protein